MNPQPLVVCWGMGQDSTGMLVGMRERGIRPELIITADVGSERPDTYAFRPIFDDWLESASRDQSSFDIENHTTFSVPFNLTA